VYNDVVQQQQAIEREREMGVCPTNGDVEMRILNNDVFFICVILKKIVFFVFCFFLFFFVFCFFLCFLFLCTIIIIMFFVSHHGVS